MPFLNQARHSAVRSLLRQRGEEIREWLGGFVFGMTYYEMVRTLYKERADMEHLFVLISFGDLLGIPILPPYYSMHLLPYIVPTIHNCRRRMLREKDLTDMIDG